MSQLSKFRDLRLVFGCEVSPLFSSKGGRMGVAIVVVVGLEVT